MMYFYKHQNSTAGISVVELLVSIALFSAGVVAFVSSFTIYTTLLSQNADTAQAALIMEEGMEALLFLRDQTWEYNIASVSLNTPYYITWNGSQYATSTTAVVTQPPFTRTIEFRAVRRNASDDIVQSGGSVDVDTRQADIFVYDADGSTVASSTMYIHNLYEN